MDTWLLLDLCVATYLAVSPRTYKMVHQSPPLVAPSFKASTVVHVGKDDMLALTLESAAPGYWDRHFTAVDLFEGHLHTIVIDFAMDHIPTINEVAERIEPVVARAIKTLHEAFVAKYPGPGQDTASVLEVAFLAPKILEGVVPRRRGPASLRFRWSHAADSRLRGLTIVKTMGNRENGAISEEMPPELLAAQFARMARPSGEGEKQPHEDTQHQQPARDEKDQDQSRGPRESPLLLLAHEEEEAAKK